MIRSTQRSFFFPIFPSRSFKFSGLMFKNLIILLFILASVIQYWSNFILLHVVIQFFNTISYYPYLNEYSRLSSKHQLIIYESLFQDFFLSFFFFFFFWSMCLFLCHSPAILITITLQYSLNSGNVMSYALFFLKIAFDIQSLFLLSTNFRIIYSASVKRCIGIFTQNFSTFIVYLMAIVLSFFI